MYNAYVLNRNVNICHFTREYAWLIPLWQYFIIHVEIHALNNEIFNAKNWSNSNFMDRILYHVFNDYLSFVTIEERIIYIYII